MEFIWKNQMCRNAAILLDFTQSLSFIFDDVFLMLSVFQDQSPNRSFDGFPGLMGPVEPVVLNHSHTAFNGGWTFLTDTEL